MKIGPISSAAALAALAAAPAPALAHSSLPQQQPEVQTPAPRPETVLVPLQSLANDVVHQRHPTAGGDGGPAAYLPFAKIRDARFSADGRLVALLVDPAKETSGEPPARRELAAKQVQWDTAGKRWITVDANLKFPELGEIPKANPVPVGESAKPPASKTLLASEIVQATVAAVPAPGATTPLTKDGQPATEAPAALFWLVPTQQTLAFAVIEQQGRHVPVPWSLLKVADDRGRIAFRVEADNTRLSQAPASDAMNEQPSADLRQRAYRHFNVAPPSWENPPGDTLPPAKDGVKQPATPTTPKGGGKPER